MSFVPFIGTQNFQVRHSFNSKWAIQFKNKTFKFKIELQNGDDCSIHFIQKGLSQNGQFKIVCPITRIQFSVK